jgi:hypothetical protein
MTELRRIIVVRAGDAELYERLQRRYGSQPGTVVLYDRRVADRRRAANPTSADRRRLERRFPDLHDILARRGYWVIRVRPKP